MNIQRASEILGIDKDDTLEVVKKKYRELMNKYHPDHNTDKDTTKKAQEINSAYQYVKTHFYELRYIRENVGSKTSRTNNNYTHQKYNPYDSAYIFRASAIYRKYQNQVDESLERLLKKYIIERSILPFEEWLIQYIEIKQCSKDLGRTITELRREYQMERFSNKTNLSFIEWLKGEKIIQKYCRQLNKTKDELYIEYQTDKMIRQVNLIFEEWLKEEVIIKEYCDRLGQTKEKLYWTFQFEKGDYGYKEDFINWLYQEISVKIYCRRLKKSRDELYIQYKYLNISNLSFLDYLKEEFKKITFKERQDSSSNNDDDEPYQRRRTK